MRQEFNRQLLLDIRPEQRPTLDSFVAGANAELLARLRALSQPKAFDAVYLWGPAGSGRTHLLRATHAAADAAHRRAVYVAGGEAGAELPCPPGGLLVVDDADRLDGTAQIALFRVFNTARLAGLALLMSGSAPPLQLALREDLRTRIGSALVYELKPLSDEDKAATLKNHAAQRGMRVDDELIAYLLRHAPRDLPMLMAVLDALDRVSLERKRPVTLPLLREVLQSLSPLQEP
ncbi:MAG: DnaA regulatory inactivator Hda [Rhodocyclaceae bacterium]|jgi:DnaA family protein|nr:DnaA regulatory inactivator Hda [Rhodocyclaceae bacterium]